MGNREAKAAHGASATFDELRRKVADFSRERAWGKFHSPKNLSMAVAVESAELLEIFQWMTEEESRRVSGDRRVLKHVSQEIADVTILLLNLCSVLGLDLGGAVSDKLRQNQRKYPAPLSRGIAKKASLTRRRKSQR